MRTANIKNKKENNKTLADKERFSKMAETYDRMAQILVPSYDFLQDEIFNIIDFEKENLIIIDIGAGSGILLEKFLYRFPKSICYWVDYSEEFLEIAKKRLVKYGRQVNFILSPIEENWQNRINSRPDIIVSMSAIHHLLTDEKKDLYTRCYNLLNNNGWLFNIDEMKTNFNDSYLESLNYWYRYVKKSQDKIKYNDINFYEKWKKHFENWKIRNIDNINSPKEKGDDVHENYLDQMNWLEQCGFTNVDLFVKFHLWCMIGGKKTKNKANKHSINY